jgi:hypothetical protein
LNFYNFERLSKFRTASWPKHLIMSTAILISWIIIDFKTTYRSFESYFTSQLFLFYFILFKFLFYFDTCQFHNRSSFLLNNFTGHILFAPPHRRLLNLLQTSAFVLWLGSLASDTFTSAMVFWFYLIENVKSSFSKFTFKWINYSNLKITLKMNLCFMFVAPKNNFDLTCRLRFGTHRFENSCKKIIFIFWTWNMKKSDLFWTEISICWHICLFLNLNLMKLFLRIWKLFRLIHKEYGWGRLYFVI